MSRTATVVPFDGAASSGPLSKTATNIFRDTSIESA